MGHYMREMMMMEDDPVARMSRENPVVIFSMTTCCMSVTVKRLFCTIGVLNPTVYELDLEPGGEEIRKALIQLQLGVVVPVVFVGGQLVGSVDRVLAAHVNGSLVSLLRAAGVDLAWSAAGGHVNSNRQSEVYLRDNIPQARMVESCRPKAAQTQMHLEWTNHIRHQLQLLGGSFNLPLFSTSSYIPTSNPVPLPNPQQRLLHSEQADHTSCQELMVLGGATLSDSSSVFGVKPVPPNPEQPSPSLKLPQSRRSYHDVPQHAHVYSVPNTYCDMLNPQLVDALPIDEFSPYAADQPSVYKGDKFLNQQERW